MNKVELVTAVAEKTGASKKATAAAIKALTEVVTDSLAKGESVQLVGFGTFKVVDRAARTGHNPKTNEKIQIPAKKAPKFVAGKTLKEAVRS